MYTSTHMCTYLCVCGYIHIYIYIYIHIHIHTHTYACITCGMRYTMSSTLFATSDILHSGKDKGGPSKGGFLNNL